MKCWFGLLLCVGLLGCHSSESTHEARVAALHPKVQERWGWYLQVHEEGFWSDLHGTAAMHGVNYPRAVLDALHRDPDGLHRLFWLSAHGGLDTAAADGHAWTLGGLLRQLGDETFGLALQAEDRATKQAVWSSLEFDFGVFEADGDEEMARARRILWGDYPITFENADASWREF